MGDFFAAYWQVVVVFVNLLFVALLAVVASLVRLQFGQISDHQKRQDDRISTLGKDVDELKGGNAHVGWEVQRLSELLERYVAELKAQRAEDRAEMKERDKRFEDAFKELRALMAPVKNGPAAG